MSTGLEGEDQKLKLKELLNKLPQTHQAVFGTLYPLFKLVLESVATTKMDPKNLAISTCNSIAHAQENVPLLQQSQEMGPNIATLFCLYSNIDYFLVC